MSDEVKRPNCFRLWLVTARAFSFPASVVAVALGLALSYHLGYPIRWIPFVLTLIGMLAFQTAANLLNDYHDYHRGLDTQVFPGSGAVVRGWLTAAQVRCAGYGALAVGIACGLVLIKVAGPVVLLLGVLGTLMALTYTRARFCLKYAGLGDLVMFIAFGLLPVFGTYWVQARRFSWQPIIWCVPLALLTVGILHANNWRDRESDREKGCRTIAGWLGETGSRRYHRILILMPFVLTLLFVGLRLFGRVEMVAPLTALSVLLALPSALKLARVDRSQGDAFTALDGATAQLQLKFGLLLTASLFLSRHLLAPW